MASYTCVRKINWDKIIIDCSILAKEIENSGEVFEKIIAVTR